MKKVLLIILLLLWYWVSPLVWASGRFAILPTEIAYQRRDDIYPKARDRTSGLGEQLYADKIINRPRVFQWLCVSNRIFLTLKPGLTALHRNDRT